MRQALLEKLFRLTIKKRELESLLVQCGFLRKSGKGSHVKWLKHGLPPIVIASHDKEIKPYMLRQVLHVFKLGGIV